MEHNALLQEAENLVNLGHFEDAFEKFMALESGTYDAKYLRPGQMALANQLKKPQLIELCEALEKEVSRNNAHAMFMYGCVKVHLKEVKVARELLTQASQMGISSASDLLRRI
ncbi:MAG: hypothetical protein K9J38_13425 [Polynucleobacter sp.]|nr:hypothetical protein [Polynucleobacter sp.]